MSADMFCMFCDVHVDLHPGWDGEPDENDCAVAAAKADLIGRFNSIGRSAAGEGFETGPTP